MLGPVRLFATPWAIHGILQARILEWVAFPFSRGSSQPGDLLNPGIEPSSPILQVDSLPAEPQGKPFQGRHPSYCELEAWVLMQALGNPSVLQEGTLFCPLYYHQGTLSCGTSIPLQWAPCSCSKILPIFSSLCLLPHRVLDLECPAPSHQSLPPTTGCLGLSR